MVCSYGLVMGTPTGYSRVSSHASLNVGVLSIRGGARVQVTRRKKQKLGFGVMVSSFFKSMADPAFGLDDLSEEQTSSKGKGKMLSKRGGKKHKLGGIASSQMSFGGAAGSVCGPNGCV